MATGHVNLSRLTIAAKLSHQDETGQLSSRIRASGRDYSPRQFFAGISPVHRANSYDSSVAQGQYSCADPALLNNFCGIDVEGSQ
nr:hypothetical protein [Erwinia sp. Ejp617]